MGIAFELGVDSGFLTSSVAASKIKPIERQARKEEFVE